MYDCGICLIQLRFSLPIPCLLMNVLDWNMISEASGSYWNENQGLNRPQRWFSELTFLEKISSLQWGFLRSFQSFSIRFVVLNMYGTIQVKKVVQNPLNSLFEDLICLRIFLNLIMCILYQFASNQTKTFHYWLSTRYGP